MMPEATPLTAALRFGLLAVLALACACSTTGPEQAGEAPPAPSEAAAPRGESEAVLAAQNALESGDCRKASESYLVAAGYSDDPEVAMRAAQLALGCENFSTARAAAARWRKLEPYDGDAALAAALVAMKRYDLEEAREALTAWRESGLAGSQDPLSFAEALQEETDATLLYRLFGEVLVGEDPTAEVLLAQARLALSAYNMEEAMQAAEQAATLDTRMLEAQTIVLRALSVKGDHSAAIAGARALPQEALQGEDAFLLADLLQAGGRISDAEAELNRLASQPATAAGAERRLVTMALRQGRLDAAERQLETMLGRDGGTALAVLYLAELAERRGDYARAIQGYGLLADSPLGLSARIAAARIMMKQGRANDGLMLLDEYVQQNPAEQLQVGLTRAHLQAETGDVKGALASLDELQKRYPDHPDIDYSRATVLETGGRTRQAVTEFERAIARRPEDPQLLNALGYTLADHKLRLGEAEEMIRKALAISPDNPAIQDSLGWLLYRRGRTGDALAVLERAWLNSSDAEIGSHFGEVLWKSGDESQARYVWQQALNGEPDHEGLKATMARLTGEDAGG
jgi:tetratricopeptide (TPR) repeat protein